MTQEEIRTQINALNSTIIAKKAELAASDYEVIKVAEGASTSISEELKTTRAAARNTINEAQASIATLEALTPDDAATDMPHIPEYIGQTDPNIGVSETA